MLVQCCYSPRMKGKCVFFNRNIVFEWNIKPIMCGYTFCRNLYLKKSIKICFSLTWCHSKKCKICATIRIYLCSCLWEAAIQEYFQSKVVLRSSHQDAFFNIAVLQLWCNFLENTCKGKQFLINVHIMLSNFEPLLWRSKYFITALTNAE